MTHTIPDTSRSKVDQDLFIYGIETFQVIVDYYSDNFELNLIQVATTESVIKATKSHFAGHGIADIITDNGPQYANDLLPLSYENGNFGTLPVRHYTVRATAKQNQPLRLPKIWLRRPSEKTKIFKLPCWNGKIHPTLTI